MLDGLWSGDARRLGIRILSGCFGVFLAHGSLVGSLDGLDELVGVPDLQEFGLDVDVDAAPGAVLPTEKACQATEITPLRATLRVIQSSPQRSWASASSAMGRSGTSVGGRRQNRDAGGCMPQAVWGRSVL